MRSWLSVVCVVVCALACAPALAPRVATKRPAPQLMAATVTASPTAAPPGPEPRPTPALFVRCEDLSNCPDAVGMLVVEAADVASEPERCTATLIAADRMLTASHCLAPAARHATAACGGTWIAFPETATAPAEWIACAQVVTATEIIDERGLHQEHAVLQLVHASRRAPLLVDATPPEPGSIVTVVSVTPHPVHGTTHVLSTRLCRAIDSTPAQRELSDAAANVGWLATCPIARGNSGSPVLDREGRIRAIVHGGTSINSGFGVTSDLSD